MATPALRAVRAAQPQAEILLEAPAPFQALFRGLPSFDRFLPAPRSAAAIVARARELRNLHVEWALLLPDSPRAALPACLARVPRRIGYARDPLRRALLSQRLPAPRAHGRRVAIPMVERYLALSRALGCRDAGHEVGLAVDAAAAETVAKRLAQCGVGPGERLLLAAAGAGFGSSKRWPPAHFASACDAIARRHGLVPVLAPAPSEVRLAHAIAAQMQTRAVVLANPFFDLAELVAAVARAALVLCGDTGPRQIAVALARPVVVVMGPTDPRHSAHQLERQRVLREAVACSPCHLPKCPIDHRCMTRLAPGRAVAAAAELLA